MMTVVFWLVVLAFLGLRIFYYYENKADAPEWNRKHNEWESL